MSASAGGRSAPGDILRSRTISCLAVLSIHRAHVRRGRHTAWRADGDLGIEDVFAAWASASRGGDCGESRGQERRCAYHMAGDGQV